MKRIVAASLSVVAFASLARAEYNVLNFGVDRGADPKTIGVYYDGAWYPLGNFSTASPYFSFDASAITSGTHGWLSLDDMSDISTKLPGLSADVQGAGQGPGLDGGTWFLWKKSATWNAIPTLRVDRRQDNGCAGDSTGLTCAASGTGFQNNKGDVFINSGTNPDSAQWEWALVPTFYNSSRPAMATQIGAVGGQVHKVRAVGKTTSATGDGSSATVTFGTSGAVGSPYIYPTGHDVYISGMTPSGYNGAHTVSASSAGSVTFLSTATGAQTVAGEIGYKLTACSVVSGTIVKLSYDDPGVPVPVTGGSGSGATATFTTDAQYWFQVGDIVTITGATPSGYNGTYTLTAGGEGTFQFASATTGTPTGATVTITRWRPQESVRVFGATPSGLNGNWKIYGTVGSSFHAGPGFVHIDYGGGASCAGFTAGGGITNISVGPSWGLYGTCTDKTGVQDPGVNGATSAIENPAGTTNHASESCIGSEIDVIVDSQDGSVTDMTDANAQRVIQQLVSLGRNTSVSILELREAVIRSPFPT